MPDNDAQAVGAEDGRPELGATLRAARDAQDLTVEQIAAELRMEPRLLHALEAHRFKELGAPVFAKGYLKQYANRLDLDYGDLLLQYYRLAEPSDVTIEPSKVIKLRDERQITIWVIAGLTLMLIAVFLFLWLEERSVDSTPAVAPSVSSTPAEVAPPLPVTVPADLDAAPVVPAPATAAIASPSLEPAQRLGGPERAGVELADTTVPATPLAAGDDSASLPPAAALEQLDTDAVRIVLDFSAESWAEITDSRGERLYYGLARPATRAELHGVPPVSFLLGNADAVSIQVDDQPFPVPLAGRRGNLARFTLDARE